MRCRVILVALGAIALSIAPLCAATPFGQFSGQVGGGNAGDGQMPLTGWALDDDGVLAVDILVDGVVAGRANYGRSRPGVTLRFPSFPDSAAPGFGFELDTTRYLNGQHTITVRVKSRSGEIVFLPSRSFTFINVEHNLAPFGVLEFPQAHAELRGNCSGSPNRRFSVISGYALDAGVQDDDSGIGYVELLIDRAVFFNTSRHCHFSNAEGGLSDCYGIRRLDIERNFPGLKDSPHAGFRFVLDIGAMLTDPFSPFLPGAHTITVRAADHASQVRNIAEMDVTFICDQSTNNENSFGDIDLPRGGLLYHGIVQTTGWALDWEGIASIRVLVDGHDFGFASGGIARPDITFFYPGFPQSLAPGWSFLLETRALENGQHFLDVIVLDVFGRETYIGRRRFVVSNATP